MKKILLTLVAALAFSGSVFAQPLVSDHFGEINSSLEDYGAEVAFLQIDGNFITSNDNYADLEIGVFVGDDLRGFATLHDEYGPDGVPYPIFELSIWYNNANEDVTFKLYDYANDIEYVNGTSNYVIKTGTDYEHFEIFDFDFDNALIFSFTTPSSGFEKEVTGYGTGEGHWYLIASPVGEVAPGSVGNMVYEETESDKFDLYCFDQSQGKEWLNYKGDEVLGYEGGFSLEPGKGYLYASKQDTTLVFNGQAYTGSGEVALTKTAGAEFEGWNLIGNPFAVAATIDKPYYKMNGDGSALTAQIEDLTTTIDAMEGVFVEATEEGQSATFAPTTRSGEQQAIAKTNILAFGNEGKVLDNAIVRFDNGASLGKFQLNASSTKVYIPQEGKDYAVVSAGEMGEIPFCFKAENNGSYTLNFTSQEVSFAYLHLIDNKTGKDVDLLESPAYSFDALTTDYANRFKLVFATGNNSEDNFAFCSNGNWIISNEGEATLQVVDVTGRILSSETVSGCVSKAISAAPGVYMLRLINGDDMKVQKVVVK